MPRGAGAEVRRRKRRAPGDVEGVSKALDETLVAAASGSTDFPLSDRDVAWDAGTANKAWQDACGIGGDSPDWTKFATGYFYRDADNPEEIGSYKLPFVDVIGGTATAIWRGITAGAARLDQTDIPDSDKTAIQGKMATYYGKAAKKYDDPSIKPPWEAAAVVASSRRRALYASLVAAGNAASGMLTNFDMTRGGPAERFFIEQALGAGYDEYRSDHWPCDIAGLSIEDGLVFRVNDNDRVYRLKDGTLVHVQYGYDVLSVHAAGPTAAAAQAACFAVREAYPASYLSLADDSRVPITFWSDGQFGPSARLRRVEAATWADVEGNYTSEVKEQLAGLMEWKDGPGADGQLLLWQGEPGTGKTWALRALASEWSSWAEFHYITDPDAFFVKNPSYMIDVLLSDSYMAIDRESNDVYDETDPGGKWRILILEDTGELLGAQAKSEYGQGLSRLLNVVDGMIGQGLRVMALVTTNDELGDLHPAVSRPGRCASQIEFGPLTAEEASVWLGEETDEGGTVAELYARANSEEKAAAPAEFAMADCANCDHAYSEHLGTEGPCTFADCNCGGYDNPNADEATEEATVASLEGLADLPAAETLRVLLRDFQFTDLAALRAAVGLAAVEVEDAVDEDAVDGGATHPEVPDDHAPKEVLPKRRTSPQAPETDAGAEVPAGSDGNDNLGEPDGDEGTGRASSLRWTAVLCPEGSPTDDGRIFAPGAITWRELPLTLMAMIETSAEGGHDGAQVAGRIDQIWREGGDIMASGEFDPGDYGMDIARMVAEGTLRGVSVDLAISQMEIAYRSDVLNADGEWIGGTEPSEGEEGPSVLDVLMGDDEEELMFVVWEATIGMATVCPFQAFADATIAISASLLAGGRANPMLWAYTHQAGWRVVQKRTWEIEIPGTVIASAVAVEETELAPPIAPPAEWFEDPELEELTALQITEDGRIFGHAAAWGTCHTGFPDVCVEPPNSNTDYSYFHLKEVQVEEGYNIACGTITLAAPHADRRMGRIEATAHYDNTGTAVCDIRVGEDEFGIWFAGGLRSNIGDERTRELRGAVLSGDWRNVNGNLELVALLAVNVPGFPVPRTRALIASGENGALVLALTAAGVHQGAESHERLTRSMQARFQALSDRASGRYAELRARAAA